MITESELKEVQAHMDKAFQLMNAYARGDFYAYYGGTDPNCVLAEVYAILAPAQNILLGLEPWKVIDFKI